MPGSLQVLATVFRSRIPWPFVSSFFILFSALFNAIICNNPGVLPFANVSDAFLRVPIDDVARFSILFTAFVARGVIHSAEQTSAGSGVDAHALTRAKAGRRRMAWNFVFIPRV